MSADTAVQLGAELIGFDTSNPPGNEERAQAHLDRLLTDAGFTTTQVARTSGRPNLVARLDSGEPGPVVGLLGHVDTVLADPDEWRHDPWSGAVIDGELWGRGALDMKGQVAAEVGATLDLVAGGWRPRRGTLLVIVTADEETGASQGARWLCDEHADLVRCDIVVNEGGGPVFDYGGQRFQTVCVGEKGVSRFEIEARGQAGHASVPRLGDNALLKLAEPLRRIGERQPPPERTPEGVALAEALLGPGALDGPDEAAAAALALERVRAVDRRIADLLLEPMLGVTLVPTMARASAKANVIPSRASVLVDCRVPPGLGSDHARARAELVLGSDPDLELRFVEEVVGNRSPTSSEAMDMITGWARRHDAIPVPVLLPGFSDSHWFRAAFDTQAYGFFPQREQDLYEVAPLIHAPDERVAVEDLVHASAFYRKFVTTLLG
ncbi:MAG: M20/M25/M40 family metallo-hydrolase [Solirubrobacterales bacterium]